MAKTKQTPIKSGKGLNAKAEDFVEPTIKPGDDDFSDKPVPKKDPKKISEEAERDLNAEIDANFHMCEIAYADWIEEAKEDIAFKAGRQWTEEDQVILRNERRPCLTFNKIKPMVKLITGHFIQNNSRIQVVPEGGEDQTFAEISDKVLDYINEQAQLEFNLDYQFAGTQTAGRAYLELYMDYEEDPIFGKLKSIYHGKPGTIWPDPRGTAYDLNEDREFVFKLTKKSKSWLKQKYPEKTEIIDSMNFDTENPDLTPVLEGDANNYGANKNRSRIGLMSVAPETPLDNEQKQLHVKEYWRFKYVKKYFVYFADSGSMPRFDSEKEAQAEIDKRRAAYIAAGFDPKKWSPLLKERMVKEMKVAIRVSGKILADGDSPLENYNGFPIFQSIADWTPEAEKEAEVAQGLVRSLKDPQRETNKARSQFLNIINTTANSGWLVDEGALDPQGLENLKNFGSSPGVVIEKKAGKSIDRLTPVPAPMAQQVREKAASDSFKEVSGLNADLLALDSNSNPSGKAIALRIRQAITILEADFRNFRLTKKLIGIAIMKMVPMMFDVPKLRKILGQNFLVQNKLVDAKGAPDDTKLKAFLIQIEDLKYNVRIAEQGDTKTLREETFEDMMNMMQNGMQIPFDVLADFMNIPNKQEMINKINAYQDKMQKMAVAAAAAKGGGGKGQPAPGGAYSAPPTSAGQGAGSAQ